jgi:hypothetical protein
MMQRMGGADSIVGEHPAVDDRYDTATGRSYVNGSSIFRGDEGMTGARCWLTVSATDSAGGFDVN